MADVLVSTALFFAKSAKFPEPLPPALEDYVGRLSERPACRRALEREAAAPVST